MTIFIERFIHDIPGKDLPGVVLHHRCDVFLQQMRHLFLCELPVLKPVGILVVLDQAVAADLHPVCLGRSGLPRRPCQNQKSSTPGGWSATS